MWYSLAAIVLPILKKKVFIKLAFIVEYYFVSVILSRPILLLFEMPTDFQTIDKNSVVVYYGLLCCSNTTKNSRHYIPNIEMIFQGADSRFKIVESSVPERDPF